MSILFDTKELAAMTAEQKDGLKSVMLIRISALRDLTTSEVTELVGMIRKSQYYRHRIKRLTNEADTLARRQDSFLYYKFRDMEIKGLPEAMPANDTLNDTLERVENAVGNDITSARMAVKQMLDDIGASHSLMLARAFIAKGLAAKAANAYPETQEAMREITGGLWRAPGMDSSPLAGVLRMLSPMLYAAANPDKTEAEVGEQAMTRLRDTMGALRKKLDSLSLYAAADEETYSELAGNSAEPKLNEP